MTGNKVGPSLKIFDLIQKLKNKTKKKKFIWTGVYWYFIFNKKNR
jgi:hypothetical protein